MPRTNVGKTSEQLAAEAEKRYYEKVLSIIRGQMGAKNISRRVLSEMTGIGYKTLCRLLRGEGYFELWSVVCIANALGMTEAERVSMITGKTVFYPSAV